MNIKEFEIIKTIPSFENKINIVRKNTSSYIFKIISSEIAFQRELTSLQFLDKFNIAPKIIDFNIDTNSILMELIEWNHFSYVNNDDIAKLWKNIRRLHEILQDFHSISNGELFTIEQCIKNLENELLYGTILNNTEKDILIKTIRYLQNKNLENIMMGNIHNDIKPENIIDNKFIDFEKAWYDNILKDLARAVIRIWGGDRNFEKILFKSYWIQEQKNDLELLKIYDCLFSISYFTYKWHKNGYPFKNISFQVLNNIIS